jgi:hypothetical protein
MCNRQINIRFLKEKPRNCGNCKYSAHLYPSILTCIFYGGMEVKEEYVFYCEGYREVL